MTKIRDYEVTCEGAPLQIEGTLSDGRLFYFRARHRGMVLTIDGSSMFSIESHVPDDPHIFSGALLVPDALYIIDVLLGAMR